MVTTFYHHTLNRLIDAPPNAQKHYGSLKRHNSYLPQSKKHPFVHYQQDVQSQNSHNVHKLQENLVPPVLKQHSHLQQRSVNHMRNSNSQKDSHIINKLKEKRIISDSSKTNNHMKENRKQNRRGTLNGKDKNINKSALKFQNSWSDKQSHVYHEHREREDLQPQAFVPRRNRLKSPNRTVINNENQQPERRNQLPAHGRRGVIKVTIILLHIQ